MMRRKHIIGPDGRRFTIADPPSPDTTHWVIRRNAEVVAAVRGGLLSLEEACSRYALNLEEFRSWERSIDRFGLKGSSHDSDSVLPQCRIVHSGRAKKDRNTRVKITSKARGGGRPRNGSAIWGSEGPILLLLATSVDQRATSVFVVRSA